MSAVAGIYYGDARTVDVEELHRISRALAVHGPHAETVWRAAGIGLVHRLRQITPEDAFENQPVVCAGAPLVVACAGRIDNRKELIGQLPIDNDGTIADSRIVAEAFVQWGEDAPLHLAGDYTAAIWNAVDRSLLLVTSPCSSRPLFYRQSNDRFVFATMPSGLFALHDVPREINEEYVVQYLSRIPRAPETSFYRGVNRLPPGHCLRMDREGRRSWRYWQPESRPELRFSRDEDYVDAFLELYGEVVSDHMRSTGGIGIMMSGGLDSTSIAAMAAPRLASRGEVLRAYTAVPRPGFEANSTRRMVDESALALRMASLYDNIDNRRIPRDIQHFLVDCDSFFRHAEWPFRNAFNRPWFEAILASAMADGVGVILQGGQGNLTVSWQGIDPISALIRQGSWRRAHREASATTDGAPLTLLLRRGVSLIVPRRVRAIRARWAVQEAYPGDRPPPSVSTKESLNRFRLTRAARTEPDDPRTWEEGRQVRARVIAATTHAGAPLLTAYRAMFGIDMRDPTADKRIVEFCLALPEDQFAREGMRRRLIRRSMTGRVPQEILSNDRRGLQAGDWTEQAGGLASALDPIARCGLAAPLIDCDTLREWLDIAGSGDSTDPTTDVFLRNYLESGLMTGAFLRWFEISKATASEEMA